MLSDAQTKELNQTDVVAIYLFGSRALGVATELSDYDYAVLTRDRHTKGDELYKKLYDILSAISPRTLKNDVLDIVYLKNTNLEMKFHVVRYGKLIYDVDSIKRLTFEEQTMLLYCDFKPILDRADAAILESLGSKIS